MTVVHNSPSGLRVIPSCSALERNKLVLEGAQMHSQMCRQMQVLFLPTMLHINVKNEVDHTKIAVLVGRYIHRTNTWQE